LPQFNWTLIWPVLFALVVGGAATIFALSHAPHPAPQAARLIAVSTADAASAGRQPVQQGGVYLNGRVIGTPHLRAEPSSNAMVLQDLQAGDTVDISGCSPSCGWYRINVPGRPSPGWVPAAFVTVQGDDQRLPVIR
jgi:hypothetical protein